MERYCSTGQSPQRAVAPTEEEYIQVLLPSALYRGAKLLNQAASPLPYEGAQENHRTGSWVRTRGCYDVLKKKKSVSCPLPEIARRFPRATARVPFTTPSSLSISFHRA